MCPRHEKVLIRLDCQLYRALCYKSEETNRSLSQLVNEALRQSLTEDAENLAAFEERRREPNLSLEAVLKDLKKRDKK